MNKFILSSLVFLFCGCAAIKHTAVDTKDYFPLYPESYYTNETRQEIQTLEALQQPNIYQKKRLIDLYNIELKKLKTSNPRVEEIKQKVFILTQDTQELQKEKIEVDTYLQKLSQPEKKPDFNGTPEIKRDFFDAASLWNRNELDASWAKINKIYLDPKAKNKLSDKELFRVANLRIRIALEMAKNEEALKTYEELKKLDDCSNDIANTAFTLSLHLFINNQKAQAKNLFENQCDPDKSRANLIRRAYWISRFQDNLNLQVIAENPYPGYYPLMAQLLTKKKITLNIDRDNPFSDIGSWEVPSSLHDELLQAEKRLEFNLKKESQYHLLRAVKILKPENGDWTNERMNSLWYLTKLFRSSGNFLEAFKLYTVLWNQFPEEKLTGGLINDLFPRPYINFVNKYSEMWNVDKHLVYAIMRQESAYNPSATSSSDAKGLMQLIPPLGKSLAQTWGYQKYFQENSLYFAEHNIALGTFHLLQLKTNLNHIALMIAAYNAGIHRVRPWARRYPDMALDVFIELIPIQETRNYVKLVLRNYLFYKLLDSKGVVQGDVFALELKQ
jgi:hypothetical protein